MVQYNIVKSTQSYTWVKSTTKLVKVLLIQCSLPRWNTLSFLLALVSGVCSLKARYD